jgi:hypothetical protein
MAMTVDPQAMVRLCEELADMRADVRAALFLAPNVPEDVRLGVAIVDAVAPRLAAPRWDPPQE